MSTTVSNSWRATKLKFAGRVVGGGTPESGNPDYWDGSVTWLTPVDLGNERNNAIVASKRTLTDAGVKAAGLERLPIGSVVFSTRAPIGSVGLLACEAVTNQGGKALVPDTRELDSHFGFYLALDSAETLQSLGLGTTFVELSTYALKNLPVSLTSPAEQCLIAAYLDEQTAKIDRLMDMRRQQMALLKEQRAALIQQAVTRGLNPNAPMKDSGLPWLGEVPAHWKVKPVKYAARIHRGRFGHRPRTDPVLYDGPYPFVQTGDVATAKKYLSSYTQTLTEKGYGVSIEFPAGTLLMAIAANIGDLAILGINACLPDSIVGFFPYIGIDVEFLYYQLSCMQSRLHALAPENTQMNLNIDRLSPEKIVVPPYEEQKEICLFINESEIKVESALSAYARQLTLLTEYRAALIHECVTGSLTVPEAASV